MRAAGAATAVVAAVLAAGLALTVADWRWGTRLVAGALLLAGVVRLALPPRTAGALVVRGRGLDTAVLLALGVGVLLLSLSIRDV